MRTAAGRMFLLAAGQLFCWAFLCVPALAADNYDDVATTLNGNWTNYGSVTTTGILEHAMSSGLGETSTNAASGSLTTSGQDAFGIDGTEDSRIANSGSITTSGLRGHGINYAGTGSATNTGSITVSGQEGCGIMALSGSVYNSGSITASGPDGIGIRVHGGGATAYNSGTISATGSGSHAVQVINGSVHLQTGTRILAGDVYGVAGFPSHLYLDGSGSVDFDITGTWAGFLQDRRRNLDL